MKVVVHQCEKCKKKFNTEENSFYFEFNLCHECYEDYPVYIDFDIIKKFNE